VLVPSPSPAVILRIFASAHQSNLRRAEKLLRNMSVVAEIQSAIALIHKHQGGIRSGPP
jgi:hypothetical protein